MSGAALLRRPFDLGQSLIMANELDEDELDQRIAAVLGGQRRRGRPRDGLMRATKYYTSYVLHQFEGMSTLEAKRAAARDYSITPQHVAACIKMFEKNAPEAGERKTLNKRKTRLVLGRGRRGRPPDGFMRALRYQRCYDLYRSEGLSRWEAKRAVARDFLITPEHVSACLKLIEDTPAHEFWEHDETEDRV